MQPCLSSEMWECKPEMWECKPVSHILVMKYGNASHVRVRGNAKML